MDSEQSGIMVNQLANSTIHNITWSNVTAAINNGRIKKRKTILQNVDGFVKAGECCAVMGPSGCGKTTLLNVLARRPSKNMSIDGSILVNGRPLPQSVFRQISCFVEQNDALIGALTIFETLSFSSRLAGPRNLKKADRLLQIQDLLKSFGLNDQADVLIGTSLRKGISGGQKRRVAVARQLVACPKIIFLDEPTSGLDSAASFQVVHYLQVLARRNNLIVICSIHQPSLQTFNLFDKLLLLSSGKPHYFGTLSKVADHYINVGIDISTRSNPADFLLELVNTDFSLDRLAASRRLEELQDAWQGSERARELKDAISSFSYGTDDSRIELPHRPGIACRTATLVHRTFVRSYRDPMAYGVRLAFSISFAILSGTVWLRHDLSQDSIQPVTSEIYFILSFLSLSAIIYGPVFIEDYLQSIQDFRNGIYGTTEFALSNFLIGITYQFVSSFIFSVICYWLSNLRTTLTAFLTWILWIFLTSFAAEALVVLIVSILPDFMFTVACASFFNSVLLCAQGFFIPFSKLNVFYKYVFHYTDYLAYSFEGLMINQFKNVTYSCNDDCRCIYVSEWANRCQIPGEVVLKQYGYDPNGQLGKRVIITVAITLGYRLVSWIIISMKK